MQRANISSTTGKRSPSAFGTGLKKVTASGVPSFMVSVPVSIETW
jgi:hypothetical protein